MLTINKKAVAGLAGLAVAVGSGGIAYAYWTTSGTGDGSAATGTSTPVTVAQLDDSGTSPVVGSDITGLVPGGDAQTVSFRITNPVSTNQYVTSVAVSIVNPNGSVWSVGTSGPACTAADFTIVQPASIATDLTPGDHDYTGAAGATIALKDTSANQDNCKGVTVPLHFVAS